ncbi:flagellin lysine-N-methylase [Clostridium sp. C2-6-12]|uniref:flagellin lysine-N-methylase n=1 Tax=Clostridium sp. C2-6-12 TaxID=2698832 RepID=UPI0013715FE8|nr:flagellin lysine-N-methylase [Clostridium sp. C2-6-12]
MKENIKMRYPSYLNEFKCIGGSCEDNCCGYWHIYIDKETFEKYKNIQDEETKKFVNDNIFVREKCNTLKTDYGQIKLDSDKICPFLNNENYCSLQTKLGEEYLSNVCTVFPRVINKIDDFYEMSLDVSCIEAARLILLKAEGINFSEEEISIGKHFVTLEIDTYSKEVKDTNYKYMREIRGKSIEIIKNKNYSLSERLYVLGSFLENLRRELCYGYYNVKEFIHKYDMNSFSNDFKRNKENYMLQLSFYRQVLEKFNEYGEYYSDYFKTKMKEVFSGFRFYKGESLIENSELFIKAWDYCEENIFEKYSYIFENYLVNHMFKEFFPFSENDIVFDGYIMMLIRFSYIKFILVGQYIYNGEISIEKIVRLIQALSKEIEHNDEYLKNILLYIKEYELDNKRFAEILL